MGQKGERNILKDFFIKNKIWIGTVTVLYAILIFILSGNFNLIKFSSTGFVNQSTQRLMAKSEVIANSLTIGNFQILIFFFSISVLCGVFFWNKEKKFKEFLNNKEDRIKYLKDSLILLLAPIVISIIINLILRSVLFAMNREFLSSKFEISYILSIMTYLYVLVLTLLGISVNLLFQIGVKSRFSAAVLPMFIFEGLILVVGVSNIFTSKAIPVVLGASNILSNLIFKYVNMFARNYRIETLGLDVFFITLLACLALTAIFLACSCRYMMSYDEKCLTYGYRFTVLRRIIILNLVSLVITYTSLVIFGSIAMFNDHVITVDKAFTLTNVVSIVLIPTVTVIAEIMYMKKHNILKASNENKFISDVSKKSKKVKAENTLKLEKMENLPEEKNDVNLENKGIIKETVTARHKNKEAIGQTNTFYIDSKNIELKDKTREIDLSYVENSNADEDDFFC